MTPSSSFVPNVLLVCLQVDDRCDHEDTAMLADNKHCGSNHFVDVHKICIVCILRVLKRGCFQAPEKLDLDAICAGDVCFVVNVCNVKNVCSPKVAQQAKGSGNVQHMVTDHEQGRQVSSTYLMAGCALQ